MHRILLFIYAVLTSLLIKSQTYAQFTQIAHDPSIEIQFENIKKHHIRISSVEKWKQSTDSKEPILEKGYKDVWYYSELGRLDSIIHEDYIKSKVYFSYDPRGRLLLKTTLIKSYNRTETNKYSILYENDTSDIISQELLEVIEDSNKIKIEHLHLKEELHIVKTTNQNEGLIIIDSIWYMNSGAIKKIKTRANTTNTLDRTNQFIYDKQNRLVRVTNTWMLALDPATEELGNIYQGENDLFDTVLKYKNNILKSSSRVVAMWPGESYVKTIYEYAENGLIASKTLVNNGEFSIYKYTYK